MFIINSPLEFYHILNDKNNIVETSKVLIQFRDFMQLYINGCQCDREVYLSKAINLYKKFYDIDHTTISELKQSLLSDKIVFNLSGVYIFEI